MSGQQRLIVCLDGTWNRQDSSTNILHHFNLVQEGLDPKTGLIQKKNYHTGVGTGVLDSVTGGGFGFGLEQNVRDAYNWLVENFHDRAPDGPPDEIYIFGFSRGAYTARSLVGFIGQCGLLRRGAPITVGQLWKEYCILGRQKEERSTAWEKILWTPEARIRQITELVPDPWSRTQTPAPDLNPSEKLLVRWSRRVRITYLGIYDTVGAIGWDALAIPGLISRMAVHNNMRPTTLIQRCRHALALDEHRSSFNHTPFLAFVGHDASEVERGDTDPQDAAAEAQRHWDRTNAMWWRKIEQRWFVGAHSNVGGGYENNCLCERPFRWILEGAKEQGLVSESIEDCNPVTQAIQMPRDSYVEFAAPLWTRYIRAKRNYRAIDPDPQPQASARQTKDGSPAPGFSLRTIHEEIDPAVIDYWKGSTRPLPPNLQEYTERRKIAIPGATPAAHSWLDEDLGAYVATVMWATLAVTGLFAIDRVTGLIPASAVLWVGCPMAFLFPLVDWSESTINFKRTLGWGGAAARAFLDSVYWSRMLGFVLMVFGAVHAILVLPVLGWGHNIAALGAIATLYGPVTLCASIAVLLASKFSAKAWLNLIAAPAVMAAAAAVLVGVGWFATILFPEIPRQNSSVTSIHVERSLPGMLLMLQLALIYFWRALLWTAEPMAKANLGSIVPLQRCLTPDQVAACLERWRGMLQCRWLADPKKDPAADRMRDLLREALWRDMLGFIPVYSLVFLFGLWIAATWLPWFDFLRWPGGGFALWWMIPLLAAVTDYIEDACHLRYCKLHEDGEKPSAPLVLFSWSMSGIKDLAFLTAGVLTLAAVFAATWDVRGQLPDWRAKIAFLISIAAIVAFVMTIGARLVHAWGVKRTGGLQAR
jgi:uncharacterized protein (DUF2235 family)